MSRTSYTGYLRQYGNSKGASPAVLKACIQFTFDPTQASASTGVCLPKGAIPIAAQNINGGGTGGSSPTIDIGTSGDPDGFGNEMAADSTTVEVISGALIGVELTVDTEIFAGVGASASGGGSVLACVWYLMADDAKA